MRRFTVVYVEAAQASLVKIWLDSADRASVREAAARIDRELRDAPKLYGTHHREGLWRISAGPLTAFFTISEDDRLVEVGGLCVNPRNVE
jgi:plasmid stabilization system protein ParE